MGQTHRTLECEFSRVARSLVIPTASRSQCQQHPLAMPIASARNANRIRSQCQRISLAMPTAFRSQCQRISQSLRISLAIPTAFRSQCHSISLAMPAASRSQCHSIQDVHLETHALLSMGQAHECEFSACSTLPTASCNADSILQSGNLAISQCIMLAMIEDRRWLLEDLRWLKIEDRSSKMQD
jgi:hypothetical protein